MITRLNNSANATQRQGRQPLFITLATLWLLAVTAILSNTAQADEPIWVFEDPTGQRTYDEVLANPQWFEQTTDTSRGFSESTYWVKLSVTNHESVPVTQMVQFDSLRLSLVEEYRATDAGVQLRSNGYSVPFSLRPSTITKTSFPIAVNAKASADLLYKIESHFKVDLGYQVTGLDQGYVQNQQRVAVGLLLFAGLIALMLYNLMLATFYRGALYVVYSAFLLASAGVVCGIFRLYELLGISADSLAIESYSGVTAYAFGYLSLFLLFKEERTKTTQRVLVLGYTILAALLTLEPSAMLKAFKEWAGPVSVFVFSYLIIDAQLKRNPLAKYVLLAWAGFIVGSLLYVAHLSGWIGVQFEAVIVYGILFQALGLSGALAYRLRNMDRTEALLKSAEVELQRERMANEIGYGYKWEFDLERQIIRPDATLAAWHGKGWQAGEWYPAQELFAAVPEEWHAGVAEDMRKAIETVRVDPEYVLQTRHPLFREDIGAASWVQVYGKLLEVDGRKLLIGTSLDVTELVESKQAVEAEVEKFDSLCERATLVFWRLDLATKAVTYNRTFAKRWSLEPSGTIQFKDFANFMTPAFVKIHEESVDQVVRTREPVERVGQALASHLNGAWYRLQYWPLFNEQGGLIGVDVINANITPLMQTQAQLESTLNKQKELFAIVGHELRTPVSTIKMLTEDEQITDSERTQQIAEISESLLSVLEDMRVVVSPERALESKTAPDNPFDIVSRSLNSLRAVIAENGLSLTKLMQQGSYGTYQIHGQALRQIVTNLVKNAAIHSGGTQIAVTMEVLHNRGDESVHIRVEDNGKGIPSESIESVFEAFARGDTSEDGSGLGLYIVKQLAERLNGSIRYTKSPIGGACFTLNFPLGRKLESGSAPVSALVSMPDNELSAITLKGMRVLLAEDDNTLRMLTERMLTKKGAVVTVCVNGKEALDAFDPAHFDLVATDLMMPEMDGHELTRAIRATGATTRIVAITAAVIGAETEQFIKEGADAVLTKPLRPDALVEALGKIEAQAQLEN